MIESLISRLEKVRATGPGTWLACCPAHEDRSPSLSIRESQGVILLHCFAGCAVDSVVSAVGMKIDDLFPPKPAVLQHRNPEKRSFPAHAVLQAVSTEAQLVAVAAANIANGCDLTDADRARLLLANERIGEAVRLANG